VWFCTQGRFRWDYLVDEMVHILSGEVFIVGQNDTERRLGPASTAFFPAGSWSAWRVRWPFAASQCQRWSVWR
jgi:uncharacterized cupin superfamily protein